MHRTVIITTLILLVFICCFAVAAPNIKHSDTTSNKKSLSQVIELDSSGTSQAEKTRDLIEKRLIEQDKRIGDMNISITISGIVIASSIALFGILITLLIIYFGFKTSKTAAVEAKSEASKEISEWLDKKADNLLIVKIQEAVVEANKRIDESIGPVLSGLEKKHEEASHLSKELKDKIHTISTSINNDNKPTLNANDLESMKKYVEWLQSRPETLYSHNDWWALGIYASNIKENKQAIDYFKKAVQTAHDPKNKALSLYNVSIALSKENKREEAASINDELIKKYSHIEDPNIQKIISYAYNNKSFYQIIKAKEHINNNDDSTGRDLLLEAKICVEECLSLRPDAPMPLENKAYILFLLGEHSESREVMQRAIALGGERIRSAAINDTQIHTTDCDQKFLEMVNSIELQPEGNS